MTVTAELEQAQLALIAALKERRTRDVLVLADAVADLKRRANLNRG